MGFQQMNVHIVRDALATMLMVAALFISVKCLQLSQLERDEHYSCGYERFNILAAFVNTVYIFFNFIFEFVENLHHIVEHWDQEGHAEGGSEDESAPKDATTLLHEDQNHLANTNLYVSIFAIVRILVILVFLYLESEKVGIQQYMQANWWGWQARMSQVKFKLRECLQWNSFRFNVYSVYLLMTCELLENLGLFWSHLLCLNFGLMENVLSLLKGMAIFALAVPLFLDSIFILIQKVTPAHMSTVMEHKMKKIAYIEGVIDVQEWHMWCRDKSHRVCTLKLGVTEDAN